MIKRLQARVVPFSSVVGSSVMLTEASGPAYMQLSVMGPLQDRAEGEFKLSQTQVAERIAALINEHGLEVDLG